MKIQHLLSIAAGLSAVAISITLAQTGSPSNPIQQTLDARDAANANVNQANAILEEGDESGTEAAGPASETQQSAGDPPQTANTPPAANATSAPPQPSGPSVVPTDSTPSGSNNSGDDGQAANTPDASLEKFDLDYTDTPVRTILRNVADAADLNVIIPDSLVGRLSLQLKNVTWPQVYDIALEGTGFIWQRTPGDIIRIQRVGADQAITVGDDGLLSVNFRSEPTRSAVQALAEVVGLNIVLPADMEGTTSASLTNVAWERILTTILEENGYQWFENDGIIGIREIDSRVVLDPQTGNLNISVENTPFQEVATLIGQTQTPVVNVVSPPEIENLQISLEVEGISFEQALNLAILKLPKVSVGQGGEGGVQQFQVYSTYQAGPNLVQIVDQQFINSLRNEPPIVRIYDLRYASAGDLLLKIMPSPGDTSQTTNEAIPSFRQRSDGVLPVVEGVQSVAADHANNLLLVTARPAALAEVTSLIQRLDQPLKQILIESKFVEITDEDGKSLGVDWASLQGWGINAGPFTRTWDRTRSQETTNTNSFVRENEFEDSSTRNFNNESDFSNSVDGNTFTNLSGNVPRSSFVNPRNISNVAGIPQSAGLGTSDSGVEFDRSVTRSYGDDSLLSQTMENIAATSRVDSAIFGADQFRLILRALEEESGAKLVTNPNVVAINGKKARVELTDYIYKPGPTETNDGVTTTGEPVPLDPRPGTTLEVTPTVVGGQLISLTVIPQVNSVVGEQTIDGNQIPTVRRRATDSEVLLRSGSTLAIGGLITDENVSDTNKVPVLGDIPVLGRLFSSEVTRVRTTNQIIFITASLLNPQSNTYMDVVGIERFNALGLTDREVQGVGSRQLSPEEMQLQQAVRQARNQAATEEIMRALKMRESIEESEDTSLEEEEPESADDSISRDNYNRPSRIGPVGRR